MGLAEGRNCTIVGGSCKSEEGCEKIESFDRWWKTEKVLENGQQMNFQKFNY